MERVLSMGAFETLDNREMMEVDGGGVVAAVYAAGFIFGCAPVTVCAVAAGVVGVGVGLLVKKLS